MDIILMLTNSANLVTTLVNLDVVDPVLVNVMIVELMVIIWIRRLLPVKNVLTGNKVAENVN